MSGRPNPKESADTPNATGPHNVYGGLRVIVVYNRKGGVGKTTVARHLAVRAALGAFGEKNRTLLIDVDSQQNSSSHFLEMEVVPEADFLLPPMHPDFDENDPDHEAWGGRSTSCDMYYGRDAWPYPTSIPHLDVLPADGNLLDDLDKEGATAGESKLDAMNKRIREWVSHPDVLKTYDFIIFDCPPSKSLITVPAVRAATDIIIPTELAIDAVDGIDQLMTLIRESARANGYSPSITILPNKVKKTKKQGSMKKALKTGYPAYMPTVIEKGKVVDVEIQERTAFEVSSKPEPMRAAHYADDKAELEITQLITYLKGVFSRGAR